MVKTLYKNFILQGIFASSEEVSCNNFILEFFIKQ